MKKILLLIVAFASGCATGTHVADGKARPAINPAQVQIYNVAPANFETLGTVGARAPVTLFGQLHAREKAIGILKHQAADIGANGVLFSPARPAEHDVFERFVRVSGTAIFVP